MCGFIMAFNELHAGYRSKLTATLKNMDLATKAFQNEFQIYTPAKTRLGRAQFQKGQPTTCKTRYAFPYSPLGYRVLATNLLPLTGLGLRPAVLARTKMGGT